jgi:hypothetical membrane protein
MNMEPSFNIMKLADGRVAGAFLFVAASLFVLGLVVAEALYPSYSISVNYISDLGVGPSAMYFNSSVFLMGLLMLIGAYFLQRACDYKVLTVLLVLTAIGAMGVGVFTENFGAMHMIVSLIAFLFGALSAVFSAVCSRIHAFKLLNTPFLAIAVMLGLMSLAALTLFAAKAYLGLGPGGMERMIVYPILIWGAGFGGYLIASPEKGTSEQKP